MKKLLIFTDLDGTLLGHHNYNWSPAKPALQRLAEMNLPLIFNSSKTIEEMKPFAAELSNYHPIIAENGSIVITEANYFPFLEATTTSFGCDYPQIISALDNLRNTFDFRFHGFNDMSIEELVAHTGLDKENAQRARTRRCSEPLLWQQDKASLERFTKELSHYDLALTRGGRFYHVMRPIDKGQSMRWLLQQYQKLEPQTQWITVALGDSHNDVQMLAQADIAVLITNPAGNAPDVSHINHLIRPTSPGPAGWNEAINLIINQNIED